MRILVDIGHPAHVHFFKNFIWNTTKSSNEVLITAREKEATLELLQAYGLDYAPTTKQHHGMMGLAWEFLKRDIQVFRFARRFKPDIIIGIHNPTVAHVSKLVGAKAVVFTDTEHGRLANLITFPFSDVICTPFCFKKDLGKKQVRYNGYHELAYLHPDYFKPDPSVLGEVGLSEGERFIVVRFVSWGAAHDAGQHGFVNLRGVVGKLEAYGRVLLSSESQLDADLERYRITVAPEKLHDLLYYATLYIGEGATMATEAAILGTPSVYISSLSGTMGNFEELESKYDLVYSFRHQEDAVSKATQLLQVADSKERWARKRERLLADKIDVTQFMVDFIENYPESFREYQKASGASAIL